MRPRRARRIGGIYGSAWLCGIFLTPFNFKKMNLQSEINRVENLRKIRVALGLKGSADLMSAVLKSAKAARTEEQKKAALESLNVFA